MTEIIKEKLKTIKGFGTITKLEISSLITTIESQQKKIEIIKTAKERLVKYTHNCRKERDSWQSRAIQAEQQVSQQSAEIESLQTENKRLIDDTNVIVNRFYEKETTIEAQKNQLESQKEEIDRLREREFNHYPIEIEGLESRIFKLQEDLEAAHDALEMLPPKDVEIHERTQIKIKETVQELVIASLKDQVESLKAIKELTVKENEELKQRNLVVSLTNETLARYVNEGKEEIKKLKQQYSDLEDQAAIWQEESGN